MKKTNKTVDKTNFEKMLEIFDETCKLHTWENRLKWRDALVENKWTDEEFDAELYKRIMEKRIA